MNILQELEDMRKAMVIRNYATKTITTYLSVLNKFLSQLTKPVESTTPDDIKNWQYYLVHQEKVDWSHFNQMVCALRFYFQKVRICDWPIYHIPFQRRRIKHPSVLSKEEVAELLKAVESNYKYHAICATLYSSGLRIAELVNLKITDIDSKNMVIYVHQGKGGKDRQVQLSNQLLVILRTYYKKSLVKPKEWLFPGKHLEKPIDRSAIQRKIPDFAKKAGITKHVTAHTLRHSFATHLLEDHTDLRTIQELLGHSNIQTTGKYLHIATHHLRTVRNPLDNMPTEAVKSCKGDLR